MTTATATNPTHRGVATSVSQDGPTSGENSGSEIPPAPRREAFGWIWVTLASGFLAFQTGLLLVALIGSFWLSGPTAIIRGGSMEPVISRGDVLLSKAEGPIVPGSVVVFESRDRLVSHRIVKVYESGRFVTKGDANPQIDSTVLSESDVAGIGRFIVPFVGLPRLWLGEGRLLLFGAWLLLVLASIGLATWLPPSEIRTQPA